MWVGVRSSASLYDANAPTITMTLDSSIAFGIAEDNRPTEDTNSNGVLDNGEDLNGNGMIDIDAGIRSIELTGNVKNLELMVDDFEAGDLVPIVFFTVRLEDETKAGSGIVLVTDGAGNTASFSLDFDEPTTTSQKGKGKGTYQSKGSTSMSSKGMSISHEGKGTMMAMMMGKGSSMSSTNGNGKGASVPSRSFKGKGMSRDAKGTMIKMRMMGKGKGYE